MIGYLQQGKSRGDEMETIMRNIVKRIKHRFGEDLRSIVLFGSMARGDFTESSDIDVLVIVQDSTDDWRAMDKIVLELAEIGFEYGRSVHITLTDLSEIEVSIEHGSPLAFELYDTNKIVFDRDGFFEMQMEKINENMKKWGAKKIRKGEWIVPGLAIINV